jgi:hypothetical protein
MLPNMFISPVQAILNLFQITAQVLTDNDDGLLDALNVEGTSEIYDMAKNRPLECKERLTEFAGDEGYEICSTVNSVRALFTIEHMLKWRDVDACPECAAVSRIYYTAWLKQELELVEQAEKLAEQEAKQWLRQQSKMAKTSEDNKD